MEFKLEIKWRKKTFNLDFTLFPERIVAYLRAVSMRFALRLKTSVVSVYATIGSVFGSILLTGRKICPQSFKFVLSVVSRLGSENRKIEPVTSNLALVALPGPSAIGIGSVIPPETDGFAIYRVLDNFLSLPLWFTIPVIFGTCFAYGTILTVLVRFLL